jgi:predicted O-methyltransferase YrrM
MNGFTVYKGIMAQQHEDYELPFTNLLSTVKPKRILEIGTGAGGFTLFLRDKLNELDLQDTVIRSYDVGTTYFDTNDYDKTNLEILKDNLFTDGNNFVLHRQDLIEPFIKSEGTTIVLCDGGNKKREFNQIAPLLKSGDIIMAHDYVENEQLYKEVYYDNIWNWCEIQEKDILDVCNQENLNDYMKEEFNKVVWVCKIKN